MKKIIAILVICLIGGAGYYFACHRSSKPNVFILLLDTLRADHLGVYGYERATSPELDRFANENIRAQWAFTAAPWTPPSVASIFSGLYVIQHGLMPPNGREEAREATAKLNPKLLVISDILKAQGYYTTAISSNPWITKDFGFDQGFDRFVSIPRAGASEVTVAAIKSAKKMKELGQPFFLYMHYLDPHDPYDPPDEYKNLFSGELKARKYAPEVLKDINLYDGEIKYLDTAVGKFIDFLKSEDLYENSIIVIVGDHGEQFGEHGNFGHGRDLFNEELHVPLLLRLGNSTEAGKIIDTSVSTIDILPTILSVARMPVPPNLLGTSIIDPEGLSRRPGIFSEIRRHTNERSFTSYDGRSIIVGNRLSNEDLAAEDPGKHIIALLDRHDSAIDSKNENATQAKDELLMEYRSLYQALQSNKIQGSGVEGDVADSTLEQLKSLGYLK